MNNPENQIWVVVVNGGTDMQYEEDEYGNFLEACRRAREIARDCNCTADVMKRFPGGHLTTEL